MDQKKNNNMETKNMEIQNNFFILREIKKRANKKDLLLNFLNRLEKNDFDKKIEINKIIKAIEKEFLDNKYSLSKTDYEFTEKEDLLYGHCIINSITVNKKFSNKLIKKYEDIGGFMGIKIAKLTEEKITFLILLHEICHYITEILNVEISNEIDINVINDNEGYYKIIGSSFFNTKIKNDTRMHNILFVNILRYIFGIYLYTGY